MFNKLFGKKEKVVTEVLVAEPKVSKRKYPKEVEAIHNEFFTAGDNILQEATCLLKQLEEKDLAKGKRLASLGFSKTREAVAAIETENKLATTKEIADLVMYYKVNYPNNKFITEEQVEQICQKYGLVCGDTTMYKGFVPENKLVSIEKFSIRDKDSKKIVYSKNIEWSGAKIGELINDGGRNARLYQSLFKEVIMNDCLKICAPIKDMDIPSTKHLVGYKIVDKPIPDPVVLQPVNGGYLVVACWGDEASDEIVVNQDMN